MKTKRQNSPIALFTMIFFIVTQVLTPLPARAFSPEVKVSSGFRLDLPSELGTVQALHAGTGPTLFHIQDAHGNYEAQKKIQAILQYLKEKQGVRLLLLEGSALKLQPELIRLFPRRMDFTHAVLDELAKDAMAQGEELFLADHPDVQAFGVENLEAYLANGRTFREVLIEQGKTENFLRDMNLQIDRLVGPYLNKDLRAFLKRLDAYEAKQLPLWDWLNSLKTEARKNLDVNLSDSAYQLEWPMLVRIFKLTEFESKIQMDAFVKEREKFLSEIAQKVEARDLEQIQSLLSSSLSRNQLPDPETSNLFERMVAALSVDFNYDAFPNVKYFIGHLLLQSEVKADRLMGEMDRLVNRISLKLAVTSEEKKILELLKDHRLLKRLFALELTPEDYEDLVERSGTIYPSNVIHRFQSLNGAKRVRDVPFTHVEKIDSLFHQAVGFYQGVKGRDQWLIENVQARMRETGIDKAVVITGGFHAEPFHHFFQERGYNYALVAPKITTSEGHEAYVRSILDYQFSTMKAVQKLGFDSPDLMKQGIANPVAVQMAVLAKSISVALRDQIKLDEINGLFEGSRFPDARVKLETGPRGEKGFEIELGGKTYRLRGTKATVVTKREYMVPLASSARAVEGKKDQTPSKTRQVHYEMLPKQALKLPKGRELILTGVQDGRATFSVVERKKGRAEVRATIETRENEVIIKEGSVTVTIKKITGTEAGGEESRVQIIVDVPAGTASPTVVTTSTPTLYGQPLRELSLPQTPQPVAPQTPPSVEISPPVLSQERGTYANRQVSDDTLLPDRGFYLSQGAYAPLMDAGILTVGQLEQKTSAELMRIPGFSEFHLGEVRVRLYGTGRHLRITDDSPIADLMIRVTGHNVEAILTRAGISTVGQLRQSRIETLRQILGIETGIIVGIHGRFHELGIPILSAIQQEPVPHQVTQIPDNTPIGDPQLNFSIRPRRAFNRLNINTVHELEQHTADELLESRNFGMTSLEETRRILRRFGRHLRDEEPTPTADPREGIAPGISLEEILNQPISVLRLGPVITDELEALQILTLRDLTSRSYDDVRRLTHFNELWLDFIRVQLWRSVGLTLLNDTPPAGRGEDVIARIIAPSLSTTPPELAEVEVLNLEPIGNLELKPATQTKLLNNNIQSVGELRGQSPIQLRGLGLTLTEVVEVRVLLWRKYSEHLHNDNALGPWRLADINDNTHLSELGWFSPRIERALRLAQINRLGDLTRHLAEVIRSLTRRPGGVRHSLGTISLQEIRDGLADYGLTFRGEPPPATPAPIGRQMVPPSEQAVLDEALDELLDRGINVLSMTPAITDSLRRIGILSVRALTQTTSLNLAAEGFDAVMMREIRQALWGYARLTLHGDTPRAGRGGTLPPSLPSEEARRNEILNRSIEVLNLGPAIELVLDREHIDTLRDLVAFSFPHLRQITNFNVAQLDSIRQALREYGEGEGIRLTLLNDEPPTGRAEETVLPATEITDGTPIDDPRLELSEGTIQSLRYRGIQTALDLQLNTVGELLNIPNFAHGNLEEVRRGLAHFGRRLHNDPIVLEWLGATVSFGAINIITLILRSEGINRILDLTQRTAAEVLRIPDIEPAQLDQIRQELWNYAHLTLRGDPVPTSRAEVRELKKLSEFFDRNLGGPKDALQGPTVQLPVVRDDERNSRNRVSQLDVTPSLAGLQISPALEGNNRLAAGNEGRLGHATERESRLDNFWRVLLLLGQARGTALSLPGYFPGLLASSYLGKYILGGRARTLPDNRPLLSPELPLFSSSTTSTQKDSVRPLESQAAPRAEVRARAKREYKVEVKPDLNYQVIMTRDVFNPRNRLLIKEIGRRRVLFVIDQSIGRKKILEIRNYMKRHKIEGGFLTLPGGEPVKNEQAGRKNVDAITGEAERLGLSRKDVFVLVGGGAVLDVAGYAASIFHRGIPYLRIPTTLLAQIDAGIGVKTGINYYGQKNFYGSFYPPQSVLVDPDLLMTLDTRQMRSGFSEAIKVSLMKDKPYFEFIEKHYLDLLNRDFSEASHAEEIMWRSIVDHLEQIRTDPFEKKLARPLDYGHEWGHRLEAVSNYQVTHGEGVAIGMAIDTHISYQRGLLSKNRLEAKQTLERILTLIENVGLPIYDRRATVENLWPGVESFRRHLGGKLTLSLLKEIGLKKDVHELRPQELRRALNYLKVRSHRTPTRAEVRSFVVSAREGRDPKNQRTVDLFISTETLVPISRISESNASSLAFQLNQLGKQGTLPPLKAKAKGDAVEVTDAGNQTTLLPLSNLPELVRNLQAALNKRAEVRGFSVKKNIGAGLQVFKDHKLLFETFSDDAHQLANAFNEALETLGYHESKEDLLLVEADNAHSIKFSLIRKNPAPGQGSLALLGSSSVDDTRMIETILELVIPEAAGKVSLAKVPANKAASKIFKEMKKNKAFYSKLQERLLSKKPKEQNFARGFIQGFVNRHILRDELDVDPGKVLGLVFERILDELKEPPHRAEVRQAERPGTPPSFGPIGRRAEVRSTAEKLWFAATSASSYYEFWMNSSVYLQSDEVTKKSREEYNTKDKEFRKGVAKLEQQKDLSELQDLLGRFSSDLSEANALYGPMGGQKYLAYRQAVKIALSHVRRQGTGRAEVRNELSGFEKEKLRDMVKNISDFYKKYASRIRDDIGFTPRLIKKWVRVGQELKGWRDLGYFRSPEIDKEGWSEPSNSWENFVKLFIKAANENPKPFDPDPSKIGVLYVLLVKIGDFNFEGLLLELSKDVPPSAPFRAEVRASFTFKLDVSESKDLPWQVLFKGATSHWQEIPIRQDSIEDLSWFTKSGGMSLNKIHSPKLIRLIDPDDATIPARYFLMLEGDGTPYLFNLTGNFMDQINFGASSAMSSLKSMHVIPVTVQDAKVVFDPNLKGSVQVILGRAEVRTPRGPELHLLDEAAENYRRKVEKVITESGSKRKDADLFIPYYELIGAITTVLDPQHSIYIYPVSGPDITFQMHAPTFILNDDIHDLWLGKQFMEEAGLLKERTDQDSEKILFNENLLSGKEQIKAYDLDSYSKVRRNDGHKFILVMKGLMYIYEKDIGKSQTQQAFLQELLERYFKKGDQIVVFTEKDQEVLESIPDFESRFERLYQKRLLDREVMISGGVYPVRTLLIPAVIAIYEYAGRPLNDRPPRAEVRTEQDAQRKFREEFQGALKKVLAFLSLTRSNLKSLTGYEIKPSTSLAVKRHSLRFKNRPPLVFFTKKYEETPYEKQSFLNQRIEKEGLRTQIAYDVKVGPESKVIPIKGVSVLFEWPLEGNILEELSGLKKENILAFAQAFGRALAKLHKEGGITHGDLQWPVSSLPFQFSESFRAHHVIWKTDNKGEIEVRFIDYGEAGSSYYSFEDERRQVGRALSRFLEKRFYQPKEKIIEAFNEGYDSLNPSSRAEVRSYSDKEIKTYIKALLKSKDRGVRIEATWPLAEIGQAAVPALIEALSKDSDTEVRFNSAWALGKIGLEAKAAIPALIESLLKDPETGVRSRVAWALGEIGPEANEAVPTLIEALKNPNKDVRWYAAGALGKIGPGAKGAVPSLIEVLSKDPNGSVRSNSAWALGAIGPEAKEAIPALTKALKDKDLGVQDEATSALKAIRRAEVRRAEWPGTPPSSGPIGRRAEVRSEETWQRLALDLESTIREKVEKEIQLGTVVINVFYQRSVDGRPKRLPLKTFTFRTSPFKKNGEVESLKKGIEQLLTKIQKRNTQLASHLVDYSIQAEGQNLYVVGSFPRAEVRRAERPGTPPSFGPIGRRAEVRGAGEVSFFASQYAAIQKAQDRPAAIRNLVALSREIPIESREEDGKIYLGFKPASISGKPDPKQEIVGLERLREFLPPGLTPVVFDKTTKELYVYDRFQNREEGWVASLKPVFTDQMQKLSRTYAEEIRQKVENGQMVILVPSTPLPIPTGPVRMTKKEALQIVEVVQEGSRKGDEEVKSWTFKALRKEEHFWTVFDAILTIAGIDRKDMLSRDGRVIRNGQWGQRVEIQNSDVQSLLVKKGDEFIVTPPSSPEGLEPREDQFHPAEISTWGKHIETMSDLQKAVKAGQLKTVTLFGARLNVDPQTYQTVQDAIFRMPQTSRGAPYYIRIWSEDYGSLILREPPADEARRDVLEKLSFLHDAHEPLESRIENVQQLLTFAASEPDKFTAIVDSIRQDPDLAGLAPYRDVLEKVQAFARYTRPGRFEAPAKKLAENLRLMALSLSAADMEDLIALELINDSQLPGWENTPLAEKQKDLILAMIRSPLPPFSDIERIQLFKELLSLLPPRAEVRSGAEVGRFDTRFPVAFTGVPNSKNPVLPLEETLSTYSLATNATVASAIYTVRNGFRGTVTPQSSKEEIKRMKDGADVGTKREVEAILRALGRGIDMGSAEGGLRDEVESFMAGEGLEGTNPITVYIDVVENTNATAYGKPGGTSIAVTADGKGQLIGSIPDVYAHLVVARVPKEKLAEFEKNPLDPDQDSEPTLRRIAEANGIKLSEMEVVVLNRDRESERMAVYKRLAETEGLTVTIIEDGTFNHAVQAALGRREGKFKVFLGTSGAPEAAMNLAIAKAYHVEGAVAGFRLLSNAGLKKAKNLGPRYQWDDKETALIRELRPEDAEAILKGEKLFTTADVRGFVDAALSFITDNEIFFLPGVRDKKNGRYEVTTLRIHETPQGTETWIENREARFGEKGVEIKPSIRKDDLPLLTQLGAGMPVFEESSQGKSPFVLNPSREIMIPLSEETALIVEKGPLTRYRPEEVVIYYRTKGQIGGLVLGPVPEKVGDVSIDRTSLRKEIATFLKRVQPLYPENKTLVEIVEVLPRAKVQGVSLSPSRIGTPAPVEMRVENILENKAIEGWLDIGHALVVRGIDKNEISKIKEAFSPNQPIGKERYSKWQAFFTKKDSPISLVLVQEETAEGAEWPYLVYVFALHDKKLIPIPLTRTQLSRAIQVYLLKSGELRLVRYGDYASGSPQEKKADLWAVDILRITQDSIKRELPYERIEKSISAVRIMQHDFGQGPRFFNLAGNRLQVSHDGLSVTEEFDLDTLERFTSRAEVRAGGPVKVLMADNPGKIETAGTVKTLVDSYAGEAVFLSEATGIGKNETALKKKIEKDRPTIVIIRSDTQAFKSADFVKWAYSMGVRVIIRMGAGVDNVNQKAAKEAGISVIATYGNAESVGNVTLRFLLAALNQSFPKEKDPVDFTEDAEWKDIAKVSPSDLLAALGKSETGGRGHMNPVHKEQIFSAISSARLKEIISQLEGKTIGLIGFGRTAQAFAQILDVVRRETKINFTVMAISDKLTAGDPGRVKAAKDYNVLYPGEAEVLAQADIFSFHIPPEEGKPYFNPEKLGQAPKAKLILNTAREKVIDPAVWPEFFAREGSLYIADIDLAKDNKPIASAQALIDTHPTEKLWLVPHIAAYTRNASDGVEEATLPTLQAVLEILFGRTPDFELGVVNDVFPSRAEVRQELRNFAVQGQPGPARAEVRSGIRSEGFWAKKGDKFVIGVGEKPHQIVVKVEAIDRSVTVRIPADRRIPIQKAGESFKGNSVPLGEMAVQDPGEVDRADYVGFKTDISLKNVARYRRLTLNGNILLKVVKAKDDGGGKSVRLVFDLPEGVMIQHVPATVPPRAEVRSVAADRKTLREALEMIERWQQEPSAKRGSVYAAEEFEKAHLPGSTSGVFDVARKLRQDDLRTGTGGRDEPLLENALQLLGDAIQGLTYEAEVWIGGIDSKNNSYWPGKNPRLKLSLPKAYAAYSHIMLDETLRDLVGESRIPEFFETLLEQGYVLNTLDENNEINKKGGFLHADYLYIYPAFNGIHGQVDWNHVFIQSPRYLPGAQREVVWTIEKVNIQKLGIQSPPARSIDDILPLYNQYEVMRNLAAWQFLKRPVHEQKNVWEAFNYVKRFRGQPNLSPPLADPKMADLFRLVNGYFTNPSPNSELIQLAQKIEQGNLVPADPKDQTLLHGARMILEAEFGNQFRPTRAEVRTDFKRPPLTHEDLTGASELLVRNPIRPFGKTGLNFFPLGVGTIWLGRHWPMDNASYKDPSPEEIESYLMHAYQKMGNEESVVFIDTAAAYGLSEKRIGEFLGKHPELKDRTFIATKWGEEFDIAKEQSTTDHSKQGLAASVRRSVGHLGKIDLLYIHKTSLEVLRDKEVIKEMKRMKTTHEGGIQAIGASISNEAILEQAIRENLLEGFDAIQMPAPVFLKRPDLVKTLHEKGIALVLNSPVRLAAGKSPKDAYVELLQRPEVSLVLAGTRTHLPETIDYVFEAARAEVRMKTPGFLLNGLGAKMNTKEAVLEVLRSQEIKMNLVKFHNRYRDKLPSLSRLGGYAQLAVGLNVHREYAESITEILKRQGGDLGAAARILGFTKPGQLVNVGEALGVNFPRRQKKRSMKVEIREAEKSRRITSFLDSRFIKSWAATRGFLETEQLAGFVFVREDWNPGVQDRKVNGLLILRLGINPQFKEKGVEKLLIEKLREEYPDETFYYFVPEKNLSEQLLMKGLQFLAEVPIRENYYGEGQNAYLMFLSPFSGQTESRAEVRKTPKIGADSPELLKGGARPIPGISVPVPGIAGVGAVAGGIAPMLAAIPLPSSPEILLRKEMADGILPLHLEKEFASYLAKLASDSERTGFLDEVNQKLGIHLSSAMNPLEVPGVLQKLMSVENPRVRTTDKLFDPTKTATDYALFLPSPDSLDEYKKQPEALYDLLKNLAQLRATAGLKEPRFVISQAKEDFLREVEPALLNLKNGLSTVERMEVKRLLESVKRGELVQFVKPEEVTNFIKTHSSQFGIAYLHSNREAALAGTLSFLVNLKKIANVKDRQGVLQTFPFGGMLAAKLAKNVTSAEEKYRVVVVPLRAIFQGAQFKFNPATGDIEAVSFDQFLVMLFKGERLIAAAA